MAMSSRLLMRQGRLIYSCEKIKYGETHPSAHMFIGFHLPTPNRESKLTKLNSSVQTLLAQTFMLTISSDPSCRGTSTCTPSHQHLRYNHQDDNYILISSPDRRAMAKGLGAHRRFPPEQQQLLCGTHLPLIDRHPSRPHVLLRVPYPVFFRIHLAR